MREMAQMSKSNMRARFVVAVLIVLIALYGSFVFPFFLESRMVEFNVDTGQARDREKILGVVYRTSPERSTAITKVIEGQTATSSKDRWVIVSQRGFLFPFDVVGARYAMDKTYRRVFLDIDKMEYHWNLRGMDPTNRMEQARTYLRLLARGAVDEASAFAASAGEGLLRRE